jgi:hypothetical protein
MFESQGDWKEALRAGKESATKHVGLEGIPALLIKCGMESKSLIALVSLVL